MTRVDAGYLGVWCDAVRALVSLLSLWPQGFEVVPTPDLSTGMDILLFADTRRNRRGCRQFFTMLDKPEEEAYPPTHKQYWNTTDSYLMGNVTPGDMRAIIQSQENGSEGGGDYFFDARVRG
jgi:hypothetical protein